MSGRKRAADDVRIPVAPDPGEAAGETEAERRGLLTLRLGEARFGLWIDEVLEVARTPPISRLPLPLPEVAGVSSMRGDVVPVLDLGVRLLDAPAARPGRLVLVRHAGSGTVVGLLVDDLEALLSVTEAEIRPPPDAAEARLPAEMAVGVALHDEGVVTILDLERAAAPPGDDMEESETT